SGTRFAAPAGMGRAIVLLGQAEGWKLWATVRPSTVRPGFIFFIFVYISRNCCNLLKSLENKIKSIKIQNKLL
ncbi:hypothetical protein, partial [Arcobacter sp.]|uniref:hypothetical protein n=1 Tax=Arcobacter sp. TaxID=1872629 RepID=UPI003D0CA81E